MSDRLVGPLGCWCLALLVGCGAPPAPYSPADAARDRVDFLQRHAARLTPEQESLIRRLPYAPRATLQTQMESLLPHPGEEDAGGFGVRHSVMEIHRRRTQRGSSASPDPPTTGEEPDS